jgi:hypothetical protein
MADAAPQGKAGTNPVPFHHLFSFRCALVAGLPAPIASCKHVIRLGILLSMSRLPPGANNLVDCNTVCPSRCCTKDRQWPCRVSVSYVSSQLFDNGGDRIAHVDVDLRNIDFLASEVVRKSIPIADVAAVNRRKRQPMQLVIIDKKNEKAWPAPALCAAHSSRRL